MRLRTTRLEGDPNALERAIGVFDKATAPLRRIPGCAAVALLADRKTGRGIALSYWETDAAMKASEEAAADARDMIIAGRGVEVVEVERFEVGVLERRQPLKEGTYARVIMGRGIPRDVDQIVESVRERVLPVIRGQKGFRSVVAAYNRKNGRLLAGSTWETAADRNASDAPLAPIRQEVMEALGAGSSLSVENFEVVFADIRVPAGTA